MNTTRLREMEIQCETYFREISRYATHLGEGWDYSSKRLLSLHGKKLNHSRLIKKIKVSKFLYLHNAIYLVILTLNLH